MNALVVIELLVLAVLCVLVAGLLRSHATILRRLHELGEAEARPARRDEVTFRPMPGMPEPGALGAFPPAADISGVDLRGDALAVSVTAVSHDTVLAFLSSGCGTCARFWRSFADQDGLALPPSTRVVVVVKSPAEESPAALAEVAPEGLVVVMSSAAWDDYRVPGSPYFVFVEGASGRVRGEGTGLDWEQVAGLLTQATGDLRFTLGDAGRRIRKPASDAERELELDQALLAIGIVPGDPSLYQVAPSAPFFDADDDDAGTRSTSDARGDAHGDGTGIL